ncbi:hypothetical protein BU26DRAFT_467555 [Trematosphaeria pertusa]|uniref:RING-type domain-containing protein n=1 Tax=Trematosphaeria pertusa TaxID=390896 RepID=A0A6A6HW85_9PLEO|nr:uncharacterized protein BU26DRAFT_467555 [Trematosphaeria pertusa]KAF2242346.1 hypothetical protein BU26DRAFT_467555 [Trematosphaeria pertusa]
MTSVFSSLVRPPKSRPGSASQTASESLTSSCPASDDIEDPNLRELNAALQGLTDIFPDVQPEVFREMLNSFSEESRLQVVTEALLKHGAKWVRGRYRMPAEVEEQRAVAHEYKYRKADAQEDTRGAPLALEDKFRSRSYKEAAKEALYHEFKGLSHSTIKAVLAEYNWSYTQARPTLLVLSSKSWRSSITNFFMRRKPPNPKDHPLVMWLAADPKTGRGRKPLLVKTKSRELDRELYDTLIVPELERQRREQVQQDLELALKWNEEEAEKEGEMYDCECCFIPNTLQQMSTCDVEGHYICFRCIQHAINAALYDQGWARNINTDFCTLKCIAPVTDGIEDCPGCVPRPFIKRALLEEKDGGDAFNKLNERLSGETLMKSQLPLIRCPFCPYAEVDDLALPDTDLLATLRVKRRPLILASVPVLELLCFQAARVVLSFLLLFLSFAVLINCALPKPLPLFAPFQSALRRIHLKRRGLRFQCLSPTCSRTSCLSCSAPWHDPHTCYSSQLTSLRLTLERATTDAVKRTCPQCNLGFVKAEGCNKLVCLCGYSMCYVCREGLAEQGYKHFCQHFRERPGEACRECDKCDLYRVEDEDAVVKRARERAEREWWEQQGEGVGGGLKKEVGKGGAGFDGPKGAWMRWKDWEAGIERLVEAVVV